MNARVLLVVPLTSVVVSLLSAQTPATPAPAVPVTPAPADSRGQALITPPAGEDQRVYGPAQTALITPDAARALSERFRAAYGQNSSPRIVVYVNRGLGDSPSGLKLTGRTERHYQTTATEKQGAPTTTTDHSTESTYAAGDTPKPTIADQQTVREVERLFGRVFRNAGAQLADPRAAMALLPDAPAGRLAGDEAAKERDALKGVADIAIEVLIASRNLNVTTVSGDSVYTVPDIQATAIRLSDAAIVGQASTSDILGHSQQAGRIARQFSVADITEATAFAVMEDMLTGAKP
jgi:hypothetical protein